jgi:hypothetical protein
LFGHPKGYEGPNMGHICAEVSHQVLIEADPAQATFGFGNAEVPPRHIYTPNNAQHGEDCANEAEDRVPQAEYLPRHPEWQFDCGLSLFERLRISLARVGIAARESPVLEVEYSNGLNGLRSTDVKRVSLSAFLPISGYCFFAERDIGWGPHAVEFRLDAFFVENFDLDSMQ